MAKGEKPTTAAPVSKGAAKFELGIGANNLFQWKFIGPDGKEVVVSKGTAIKDQCYQEIRNVKENANIEHRYQKSGSDGKFVFRLRAANHQIVAESVSFATEADRDEAMGVMKRATEAVILGSAI